MLGGGVFVTQNKTLPGSYINFVSTQTATSPLGERGIVAIALPLEVKEGEIFEVTSSEFGTNAKNLFGVSSDDAKLLPLREIFHHATKVYVYDLGATKTVADVCAALEPYEFNVLCAYTDVENDVAAYISHVTKWRDEMGKKCQVVVYNAASPDYEGVINVVSTVTDSEVDAHALVAWVAGIEAGCAVNESCTNRAYDGELNILCNKTQEQLEDCIENGQIAFHLVYGNVCLLEDINSLTTTTTDKGEDFKYNQTIRVIDQIANDIAKLFNTKYLGKIPNNASGRVSLWADIVAHHRLLENIQAIEDFDSELVKVEAGANKKTVIVQDAVKVVNSMAILYMTVVVQ